jgi:phosphatidylinositol 4-kinase
MCSAPELAITITHHIRRFLASPTLAFEAEVTCGSGSDIPDLVLSAAKCLATCVQLAPGDDLISSTLYSLLNNITHGVQGSSLHPGGTGNGAHSVRSAPHFAQDTFGKADGATVRTVGTGPRSDEQRRLVGMTTVGVVAHLALEVGREDVSDAIAPLC